jgi:hypothetical protein
VRYSGIYTEYHICSFWAGISRYICMCLYICYTKITYMCVCIYKYATPN